MRLQWAQIGRMPSRLAIVVMAASRRVTASRRSRRSRRSIASVAYIRSRRAWTSLLPAALATTAPTVRIPPWRRVAASMGASASAMSHSLARTRARPDGAAGRTRRTAPMRRLRRVRADEQRWLGRELNQRRHDQQVQDDAREDRRLIRSTSDGAPAQEWYAGCDQGDQRDDVYDDGLHSDEGASATTQAITRMIWTRTPRVRHGAAGPVARIHDGPGAAGSTICLRATRAGRSAGGIFAGLGLFGCHRLLPPLGALRARRFWRSRKESDPGSPKAYGKSVLVRSEQPACMPP